MGFIDQIVDQILCAFGNSRAMGRVELRSASKIVRTEWEKYAGRNGIRTPTLGNFRRFMALAFGIQTDEDDDIDLAANVNLDVLIPRVANILIDNGTIVRATPGK